MMDHPATKSPMDEGDDITNVTLYKDIGFSTVEEAQDIFFELARARIGPETVQQICAAMMQVYFGRGVNTSGHPECSDTFAALSPHAPLRVVCHLHRRSVEAEWACTRDSWRDQDPYPLCLEAVEGLTLTEFVVILIKYAGLFKHEMKLRGLVLNFLGTSGIWPYCDCQFLLGPDSGVYVAR